ncbi:MAG: transketolase [Anaerolineae bacterium]|nr:transketolase [Anaerolineae bacterium]
MYSESLIAQLEERARQLRCDVLQMVYDAGSGHPGGSLSAAEIIAALYFQRLRLDPNRPDCPERDRFILSKGHAAPTLYAALARRGFFPVEELCTLRQLDSRLQGHPDRLKTPGVEMTSGALGHGVAIGAGLALAARRAGQTWRTYVLLGDGEVQAGVVWEGALIAAKYGLSHLTCILDQNDVQLDGPVHEILPLEPLVDKWRAFGWATVEIDGHNVRQILEALDLAANIHDRPTMIVAHTTKGRGCSFMEGKSAWHGRVPSAEELACALEELNA